MLNIRQLKINDANTVSVPGGTISLYNDQVHGWSMSNVFRRTFHSISLTNNWKEARVQKQVLGAELQKVFQSLTILF